MRAFILVVLLAVSLFGCSGGPGQPVAGHMPTDGIEPQEGYVIWSRAIHPSIGPYGRLDYKEAMHDDCMEDSDPSDCSVFGRGWFVRWGIVAEYCSAKKTYRPGVHRSPKGHNGAESFLTRGQEIQA